MISYFLFLSINLFSSLQEYHKVNTRLRHSAFFFARDSASPQVWHVKLSRFTFHRSVPGCFLVFPLDLFPVVSNLRRVWEFMLLPSWRHALAIWISIVFHRWRILFIIFFNKNWGLSSCYFLITATDNYTDVWWMLIKIFDSNWTPLNT